jgi:nicotinamidase-related amidase
MTSLKNMSQVDSSANLKEWIFPWPEFDLDWAKTALLIIDCQNYSSNPDCGLSLVMKEKYPSIANYYIPRITQKTIPNTKRLLDKFRALNTPAIYTRHGALLPDGSDMIERRRRRDQDAIKASEKPAMWSKGDFEHDIISELKPMDGELVVDKNSSSPFNGTGVDQLLKNLSIDSLIVAGMATDMCVETTSRDVADRGYNVIVAEDAVATFVEQHHYAALSGFSRVFGKVWNTEDILNALDSQF